MKTSCNYYLTLLIFSIYLGIRLDKVSFRCFNWLLRGESAQDIYMYLPCMISRASKTLNYSLKQQTHGL